MSTYICSYFYGAAKYSFEIKADSPEDAAARLRAIANGAIVDGVLILSIPAHMGGITVARFIVRVLNLLRRIRP